MYYDKIISEYTLKLTKLCHFKKFSRRNIMPPKHSIYRTIEPPNYLLYTNFAINYWRKKLIVISVTSIAVS